MMLATTILILLIAVLLIVVVLAQNPKGGGLSGTFGGNQASQLIGAANSADVIEKVTWGLASGLLVLCIVVSFMGESGPQQTGPSIDASELPATQQPIAPQQPSAPVQ